MRNFFTAFTLISLLMFSSGASAQVVLDGVPVGTNNPNTGKFTNLEATTQFTLGTDTATSFDDIDSEKVKSSATDSTPGFLSDELQAGSNVTLSGTESITISVPDTLTTKGDVLYHNGTSETRLAVGASGQILTTDSNDNLLWANPAEGDQLFNSNVLLNSYRTAENLDLTVLKMIDGAVDAFTDETGVDTTASTNEEFDNVNSLYQPVGSPFAVPFVTFDGTNDYLTISDTALGGGSGKKFLFSAWYRSNANGGGDQIFIGTPNNRIQINKNASNDTIRFVALSATTNLGDVSSTTAVKVADGLTHILVAIDMDNSNSADRVKMRINGGAVETLIVSTPIANDFIDIGSNGSFGVGANPNGTALVNGEFGQLYFAEEFLDISTAANLAKFYDNGNPVDLGSNGSIPTGTQPLIFLDKPLANWQDNLGSGGNFTEVGELTAGTDVVVASTPENMTLISNSQTAKFDPSGANILLLADKIVDDDLNENIIASVRRNGVDNFALVNLENVGDFEDGSLYTGTVDLSGQSSGTDMQWKVETLNNIELNLHGVGLEWR